MINYEVQVRLRSEIWVKAYLRICQAHFIPAMIMRRGDRDAGAVFIKINRLDGTARLFGPAPGGFDGAAKAQLWMAHMDGPHISERKVDDFLKQQAQFDSDVWVIETEDKNGRHFLGEWLRVC